MTSARGRGPAVHAFNLEPRQKAVVVAGTLLALFVAAIDQTVVNTALPRIIGDLGGLSLFSWVITAYLLTSTTSVPLAGKLSDLYGRKPFMIAGIVIFTATSIFAGASQSMVQLITARGFQGIGAGLIMANSFAMIGELFPPDQRARYQGLFAAVFGVSSVIGPLIGGAFTDHLSWRWVFYVNIPFGMAAISVLWFFFPNIQSNQTERRIDYLGGLTLTVVVIPLLLALVWGGNRDYAWDSAQIIGLFAASAVGLVVFVLIELRAADPVLPLSLFRNRIFVTANLAMFFVGVCMFGAMSYTNLFVQGVLGFSATNSGVTIMPMTLGLVVSSVVSGQVLARVRFSRPFILAGAAVLAVGMFLLSRMAVDTAYLTTVRNMVVIGFGVGLALPVLALVVQNALPFRMLGVASSSSQFFRQIGGTLGVAIFGTLVSNSMADLPQRLPPALQQADPQQIERLQEPNLLVSPDALDQVRQAFAQAGPEGAALFEQSLGAMRNLLATGITDAYFVGMVVAVLAFAVTLFLPELRLRTAADMAEEFGATPELAAVPAEPLPPGPVAVAAGEVPQREGQAPPSNGAEP